MRILMVNYEYPPLGGGGGVIHHAIASELARRHEVTVLTSRTRGLSKEELREGVRIVRTPILGRRDLPTASLASMLSFFPSSLLAGTGLLRRGRFDLINTHFAIPSGPSAVLLARGCRLPHVLSLHGGDLYDPSKKLSPHRIALLRAVVRFVIRSADRVVAQSRNTRQNAYRYYGVNRDIDLIPHGIASPQFRQVTRAQLGLGGARFVLVTVGRLVRRKSVDHLIRALGPLRHLNAVLAIVGSGPEEEALMRCAAELGVGDRVVFMGQVEEERKWQILGAADLYVSSTLHEGFGLTYLEAMRVGLPIVSYSNGGQSDFLRQGETGALLQPGDIEGLSKTIRTLLINGEARRRMSTRCQEVAAEYSIEGCARSYEAIYEAVIAEGPVRPGAAVICPEVQPYHAVPLREQVAEGVPTP